MIEIMSRESWQACEARLPQPLSLPAENVLLAYSRDLTCTGSRCRRFINREQNRHMSIKSFADIAYNFLVDSDGVIYEGRGFEVEPAVPIKFKPLTNKALYIVIIGEFTKNPPKDEVFEQREKFLEYCVNHNYLNPNYKSFVI